MRLAHYLRHLDRLADPYPRQFVVDPDADDRHAERDDSIGRRYMPEAPPHAIGQRRTEPTYTVPGRRVRS